VTRRRVVLAAAAAAVLFIAGVMAAVSHDSGSSRAHTSAEPEIGAVSPVTSDDSTTTSLGSSTSTSSPAPPSPGVKTGPAPRQQSTATPSAAFSGPPIVFARNSQAAFEVWMMNLDGSGQRRIDTFPQSDSSPPDCSAQWTIAHNLGDWAPDGSRFFVLSRCPGTDAVIYDRNGHRLQRFRVSGDSGLTDAAWSPDGTQLAADSEDDNVLNIVDVATGHVARTFSGFGSHYIGWAPASRIAFVGFKMPEKQFGLFTVDPTTGDWRLDANGQLGGRPRWTPDGRVVFRYQSGKQYDPNDPTTYETLAVAHDVSNADVVRLCGDAGDFRWAPDFRSVVAAIIDRQGNTSVSVRPANGGGASIDLGAGVNPAFDSLGHIVFSAGGNTWIVNADGSGRRMLAAGGPAEPAPR
jgi:Tol biopolymer transport system component